MLRYAVLTMAALALALGTASADPSGTNVVINEVFVDPPYYYDGAEYIELYNPTAAPILIAGWVLAGTEYDQNCGGEDRWEFPPGTVIGAKDYIVVAKDGGDLEDGFFEVFGFRADFEMWDDSAGFDSDDTNTPDMINVDNDPAGNYSDEIQLVGGRGYGVDCSGGTYSNSDVVYLYTSVGLGTLVDVVEYYDDYECGADPCVGDDLDDESGYAGIPFPGVTLGRDQYGTDTDRNVDDFGLFQPTPGSRNSLNAVPWIRTVRYSPTPPTNMGAVTVSATVTDDHGVTGVDVHYNAGGGWLSVAASTSDTVYSAVIPGQPDGTEVLYYVEATDDSAYAIAYPIDGQAEPNAYSVGLTGIYDVQFVAGRQDESPLEGHAVNIRGIVTGESPDLPGYFFVHDADGAYHGIMVMHYLDYDILEGDDVTVGGMVREVYNETRLYPHFDEAVVVHSSGNPNHGYTTVTGSQIAVSSATSEPYEGQLVRLVNAEVTSAPDAYGQWNVSDDAGASTVQVDDAAYYVYEAEVSDDIAEIRGLVMYSFNQYDLNPRYEEDIIGPPRVENVRYSPAPPQAGVPVTVSCDISAGGTITSAKLYWKPNASGVWNNVDLVHQGGGEYSVDLGPFIVGDEIDYYVLAADDAGMDARRPSTGNYGFYIGTVSIYDIQYVVSPGVDDASPLVDHAVNVEGWVVAEPGVFGPYSFYIADAEGPWNGIMVYDGSASLVDDYTRGDLVTVSGTVSEYYGQTELRLHFPEAAHVLPSRGDEIGPTDVLSGELQSANLGEQYEGVFVSAGEGTVVDENKGYNRWSLTNTGAQIDDCWVGAGGDYDYEPVRADTVYIRGVVDYDFGVYRIQPRGNEDIAVPTGVPDGAVGRKLALAQNRPNPFNPKTTIAFSLPEPTDVTLEIYDVAGRRVTTLVDRRLGAGPHAYEWDGRTQSGERVASGVYFYRLSTAGRDLSKKMVLLK